MKEDFKKMKIAIRYWLLGRHYHKAVEAMDFAEGYHNGTRKDGDHEFSHQISQANYMRVFVDLLDYPEETFIVIFLHDILEDYPVKFDEIATKFGQVVANAVLLITKVRDGIKIPNDHYYGEMTYSNEASNQITCIAKGADRLHNLMTMLGGFTPEKQMSYIEETLDYVVPMIKKARNKFPRQEGIFHNMKYIITNHVRMYTALNQNLVTT